MFRCPFIYTAPKRPGKPKRAMPAPDLDAPRHRRRARAQRSLEGELLPGPELDFGASECLASHMASKALGRRARVRRARL